MTINKRTGQEFRYFVSFSVAPYVRGERWAWPTLFDSRSEAEQYMGKCENLFAQNIPGRRIVSAAVSHVAIPRRSVS